MTHPQTLIAKQLEDEGRSQAWLARKLRVSRQTMGAWLRAEEPCPLSRQAQIATHLNVKAAAFFDRKRFAIIQQEAPR